MKSACTRALKVFIAATATLVAFGCSGGFLADLFGTGGDPSLEVRRSTGNIIAIGESASFTETAVGDYSDLTFSISNDGDEDTNLNVKNTYINDEPFSIEAAYTGDINTSESKQVTVRFSPTQSGDFTGTVHISTDDPDDPDYYFNVSGTATSSSTSLTLAPPAWIQGTWNDPTGTTVIWTFSSDNAVLSGAYTLDCKQYNSTSGDANNGIFDSEPASMSYRLEIKTNGSVSTTMDFVANQSTNPTSLTYTASGSPSVMLTKQ